MVYKVGVKLTLHTDVAKDWGTRKPLEALGVKAQGTPPRAQSWPEPATRPILHHHVEPKAAAWGWQPTCRHPVTRRDLGELPTTSLSGPNSYSRVQCWALCCAIQEAAWGAGGESCGLSDQVPCQEAQLS